MAVAVLDYGAGNLRSVCNALQRLGTDVFVSKDPERIRSADRVIFPGVGHAQYAMHNLVETGLHKLIPELTQPVLGICLGFQLMCNSSQEGNTLGLSIFNTTVLAFPDSVSKVPHMGWNAVQAEKNPLFDGIYHAYFYHVHSYYAEQAQGQIASCEYVVTFATAMQKANFYGVQFHPEKSAQAGERLLENFLKL